MIDNISACGINVSRRTVETNIPTVKEEIKNKMKAELANKNVWLCVDEMTYIIKNSTVNAIVGALGPLHFSSLLLANKRVVDVLAKHLRNWC